MHEKIFKAIEYYGIFFKKTSKITYCTSSFSFCLPFNSSSCTTENVGRLVTPAKKLEDTIRLAELVIEVLQQNEEHHAEVSSEVVSPRPSAGSGGLLGALYICVMTSRLVLGYLLQKPKESLNNGAWVWWRQSTVQEDGVLQRGGRAKGGIKFCSPLRQPAAFHTAPAGAESGQIYSPPTTYKSKPVQLSGRLYFQIMSCVCASRQH